ncbi:unnamed protein product [Chrysoparadoxa australica]
MRRWDLACLCLVDIIAIFKAGKRTVLRCLLQCLSIIGHSEYHYLLNKLFVEDYTVWIQGISDDTLAAVAADLQAVLDTFSREDAGLGLPLLEQVVLTVEAQDASDSLSSTSSDDESSCSSDSSSNDTEGSTDHIGRVEAQGGKDPRAAATQREELEVAEASGAVPEALTRLLAGMNVSSRGPEERVASRAAGALEQEGDGQAGKPKGPLIQELS